MEVNRRAFLAGSGALRAFLGLDLRNCTNGASAAINATKHCHRRSADYTDRISPSAYFWTG